MKYTYNDSTAPIEPTARMVDPRLDKLSHMKTSLITIRNCDGGSQNNKHKRCLSDRVVPVSQDTVTLFGSQFRKFPKEGPGVAFHGTLQFDLAFRGNSIMITNST